MNSAENNGHHVVHVTFSSEEDKKLLNNIKQLTGYNTGTKAVYDALRQLPVFIRKSDELNAEVIRLNREIELRQAQYDRLHITLKRLQDESNI